MGKGISKVSQMFKNERQIVKKTYEEAFEEYMITARVKCLSEDTINSYIQNISPVLKFCIKRGYILEDFLVPRVKTQEIFKEILTEDEINALLEPPKSKDFVSIRILLVILHSNN